MTQITVVSTFHEPVLDLYGKKFIESFGENVDEKINLWLYTEGFDLPSTDPRMTFMRQETSLPKLMAFKEKWKDVPKANGICPFPERRPRDYHKEFKWHAIRFANKVYAVFDACKRADTDWVVWMDADCVVHSPWSYEQFSELLPNDKWITYVGRGKGSQTWPECGFYGLNVKHPTCRWFMKEFERFYEDAENGLFTLDEWHDSYIFGHILADIKKGDPRVLDYSSELYNVSVKSGGGGHPLINGPLGQWLDHLKGDRKKDGKSKAKDLMLNRKEDWWKS
jgi:hypothetical protein